MGNRKSTINVYFSWNLDGCRQPATILLFPGALRYQKNSQCSTSSCSRDCLGMVPVKDGASLVQCLGTLGTPPKALAEGSSEQKGYL